MIDIREENSNDIDRITEVEYAAFKNHPMHPPGAEPVEQRIVAALRKNGGLALSLVAEEKGEVVGHIALSPAGVGGVDQGWYLLGPVAVTPGKQGRGIGSALIGASLERLRARGAAGVVLVGDPAFYARFGFAARPGLTYPGVPGEYVLGVSFTDAPPRGAVTADPAFGLRPE